jgi:hypothetical protein
MRTRAWLAPLLIPAALGCGGGGGSDASGADLAVAGDGSDAGSAGDASDTGSGSDVPRAGDAAGGATGSDAGTEAAEAGAVWPTNVNECVEPRSGVSPQQFCAREMTVCGFTGVDGHYTSLADCLSRYGGFITVIQGCVAYHLCLAGTPGNDIQHCQHTGGASATGTQNACGIPP